MNIIYIIKKLAFKVGIDVRAFMPARSEAARLFALFQHYGIDLVLDVGANSGQFAEYLRAIGYKGKIVCFEPLTDAYTKLQKLAREDVATLLAPRMALGDYDGEVTVNVSANSESSSILQILETHVQAEPTAKYVGAETVRISRLDSVAKEYLLNAAGVFLKIDAQGYGSNILQGASGIMSTIKGIQLELSLTPLYEGEPLYRDMIDAVEELGFQLNDINPCYSDNNTGKTYQCDGIFFRSEKEQ